MILEAKNIGFRYKNGGYILKNVDFTIPSGEIVALIAKSGYGKTTFAKIMAGYLKQSWGEVLIGGEKRGLSRTVVELSDHFVQIFYPTQIKAALSAAASAAVLCFEVVKQRMEQ